MSKEKAHSNITLDLEDVDLNSVRSLKDTALENIIKELQNTEQPTTHAKHHSHHSYSTHGTGSW